MLTSRLYVLLQLEGQTHAQAHLEHQEAVDKLILFRRGSSAAGCAPMRFTLRAGSIVKMY